MNAKFHKLILLLMLDLLLLFQGATTNRSGKHAKTFTGYGNINGNAALEDAKNNMKGNIHTTAMMENSDDNQIQAVHNQDNSNDNSDSSGTIRRKLPANEIPTSSNGLLRRKQRIKNIKFEKEIEYEKTTMEMLFRGKNADGSRNTGFKTRNSKRNAAKNVNVLNDINCDILKIKRHVDDLIRNKNLTLQEVSPIWTGEKSQLEKIKSINETLKRLGLPLLVSCETLQQHSPSTTSNMPPETTTKKTTFAITTPYSSYEYGDYDDSYYTDYYDNDKDDCSPEGAKAIIQGYVFSGQLSYESVQPLTSDEMTPFEKLMMVNKILVEHNLPPLNCGNATQQIDDEKADTNKNTTKCNLDEIKPILQRYVSSGSLTFQQIKPILSESLSLSKKMQQLNRILAEAMLPKLASCELQNQSEQAADDLSKQDEVRCDPNTIRFTLQRYFTSGQLSMEHISPMMSNNSLSQKQKLQILNKVLLGAGLPIISCDNESLQPGALESTTLNGELLQRNIMETTTLKDESLQNSIVEMPTIKEINECGPEAIRKTILSYVFSNELTLQQVQPVQAASTQRQKIRLLNQILADSGLPTLTACEKNEALNTDDCKPPEINVKTFEEARDALEKLKDEEKLPAGAFPDLVSGNLTLEDLQTVIRNVNNAKWMPPKRCINESSASHPPPRVEESRKGDKQKLNQLLALIEAGYLPPDTLQKLALGEITEQWLRANLSQNRDFILSKLPHQIRTLIDEGKMPPDIEAAIFSGSANKTEILKMMVEDDDVIKALLPQNILNMLQDKPVPDKLKVILASGKNASEIKKEVLSDEELLQQLMSPSTYFFYELFQDETKQRLNVAISATIIVVLLSVMVSLGCTMTISKIAEHAKRPKGVIIALFSQFVIMPASAFGLTQAFDLQLYAAMAVLICGCCPGGNLSNMLAYALQGDMNLSILMTTCSSVIGLGMMPLSIFLYSRFIIPVDSGNIIPFDKIIFNIGITIIPVALGIAIRHFKPQWVTYVMRAGACILTICSIAVAVMAGIMFGDAFFIYFPLPVLYCCAILPITGYLLGYLFAMIAGERPKCRRTICMETGCQNVQLCSSVLKLAFDPILVGVLFLMPLVYMLFQVVEALLIISFFRVYNRIRGIKELEEEETEEKKKSDLESGVEEKKTSEVEEMCLLDKSKEQNCSNPSDDVKPSDETEITEKFPLVEKPSEACLDSFKKAGTENFV